VVKWNRLRALRVFVVNIDFFGDSSTFPERIPACYAAPQQP